MLFEAMVFVAICLLFLLVYFFFEPKPKYLGVGVYFGVAGLLEGMLAIRLRPLGGKSQQQRDRERAEENKEKKKYPKRRKDYR